MIKAKSPKIKLISAMLAFSFFVQELAHAAPAVDLFVAASPSALSQVLNDPRRLEIPADFCTLKEINGQPGKPLIIQIEDAHTNVSGQQNLSATLDALMSRYSIGLVLSEGGIEDCTLTPIKKIASPQVWKRIAKKYLMDGKISGEEYLNLSSDHPMSIIGLEDKELYLKSVQNYAALADKREKILEHLAQVRRGIEKLKNRVYPADLLGYEKTLGKDQGWEKRFRALLELAAQKNIDLEVYPNAEKLVELELQEKLIDFNLASLEWAALAQDLKMEMPQLASKSRLSQMGLILEAIEAADKKGLAVSKYPNLKEYAAYLQAFADIDLDALLLEFENLEDALYVSALSGEDAKLIRSIDRYLGLLETAYQIQMTTRQFELFSANEPDFSTPAYQGFINRKLVEWGYAEDLIPVEPVLEEGRLALKAFYDSVTQRDFAFLKNAEKAISENKSQAAFVIAGGYHTPHLKKLLADKGYSTAVLTPHVTGETNQKKYEQRLLHTIKGGAVPMGSARSPKGDTVRPILMRAEARFSADGSYLSEILAETVGAAQAKTVMRQIVEEDQMSANAAARLADNEKQRMPSIFQRAKELNEGERQLEQARMIWELRKAEDAANLGLKIKRFLAKRWAALFKQPAQKKQVEEKVQPNRSPFKAVQMKALTRQQALAMAGARLAAEEEDPSIMFETPSEAGIPSSVSASSSSFSIDVNSENEEESKEFDPDAKQAIKGNVLAQLRQGLGQASLGLLESVRGKKASEEEMRAVREENSRLVIAALRLKLLGARLSESNLFKMQFVLVSIAIAAGIISVYTALGMTGVYFTAMVYGGLIVRERSAGRLLAKTALLSLILLGASPAKTTQAQSSPSAVSATASSQKNLQVQTDASLKNLPAGKYRRVLAEYEAAFDNYGRELFGDSAKSKIVEFVMVIGSIESGFERKTQLGGGPALGYLQIEPETIATTFIRIMRDKESPAKKTLFKNLNAQQKSDLHHRIAQMMQERAKANRISADSAAWIRMRMLTDTDFEHKIGLLNLFLEMRMKGISIFQLGSVDQMVKAYKEIWRPGKFSLKRAKARAQAALKNIKSIRSGSGARLVSTDDGLSGQHVESIDLKFIKLMAVSGALFFGFNVALIHLGVFISMPFLLAQAALWVLVLAGVGYYTQSGYKKSNPSFRSSWTFLKDELRPQIDRKRAFEEYVWSDSKPASVEAVDLHSLPDGTVMEIRLKHYSKVSYILQKQGNQIKVWLGGDNILGEVPKGCAIGDIDSLTAVTTRLNKGWFMDTRERLFYKGMLRRGHEVTMPYFTDEGLNTKDSWTDTARSVVVQVPVGARLSTVEERRETRVFYLSVAMPIVFTAVYALTASKIFWVLGPVAFVGLAAALVFSGLRTKVLGRSNPDPNPVIPPLSSMPPEMLDKAMQQLNLFIHSKNQSEISRAYGNILRILGAGSDRRFLSQLLLNIQKTGKSRFYNLNYTDQYALLLTRVSELDPSIFDAADLDYLVYLIRQEKDKKTLNGFQMSAIESLENIASKGGIGISAKARELLNRLKAESDLNVNVKGRLSGLSLDETIERMMNSAFDEATGARMAPIASSVWARAILLVLALLSPQSFTLAQSDEEGERYGYVRSGQYLDEARQAYIDKNYERAIDALSDLLKNHPLEAENDSFVTKQDFKEVFYLLGMSYAARGEYNEAFTQTVLLDYLSSDSNEALTELSSAIPQDFLWADGLAKSAQELMVNFGDDINSWRRVDEAKGLESDLDADPYYSKLRERIDAIQAALGPHRALMAQGKWVEAAQLVEAALDPSDLERMRSNFRQEIKVLTEHAAKITPNKKETLVDIQSPALASKLPVAPSVAAQAVENVSTSSIPTQTARPSVNGNFNSAAASLAILAALYFSYKLSKKKSSGARLASLNDYDESGIRQTTFGAVVLSEIEHSLNLQNEVMERLSQALGPIRSGKTRRILSIGAGHGNFERRVLDSRPDIQIVAIDISAQNVSVVTQKMGDYGPRFKAFVADANDSSALTAQGIETDFDAVLMLDVIGYLNPEKAFSLVSSAAKPGAGLILTGTPFEDASPATIAATGNAPIADAILVDSMVAAGFIVRQEDIDSSTGRIKRHSVSYQAPYVKKRLFGLWKQKRFAYFQGSSLVLLATKGQASASSAGARMAEGRHEIKPGKRITIQPTRPIREFYIERPGATPISFSVIEQRSKKYLMTVFGPGSMDRSFEEIAGSAYSKNVKDHFSIVIHHAPNNRFSSIDFTNSTNFTIPISWRSDETTESLLAALKVFVSSAKEGAAKDAVQRYLDDPASQTRDSEKTQGLIELLIREMRGKDDKFDDEIEKLVGVLRSWRVSSEEGGASGARLAVEDAIEKVGHVMMRFPKDLDKDALGAFYRGEKDTLETLEKMFQGELWYLPPEELAPYFVCGPIAIENPSLSQASLMMLVTYAMMKYRHLDFYSEELAREISTDKSKWRDALPQALRLLVLAQRLGSDFALAVARYKLKYDPKSIYYKNLVAFYSAISSLLNFNTDSGNQRIAQFAKDWPAKDRLDLFERVCRISILSTTNDLELQAFFEMVSNIMGLPSPSRPVTDEEKSKKTHLNIWAVETLVERIEREKLGWGQAMLVADVASTLIREKMDDQKAFGLALEAVAHPDALSLIPFQTLKEGSMWDVFRTKAVQEKINVALETTTRYIKYPPTIHEIVEKNCDKITVERLREERIILPKIDRALKLSLTGERNSIDRMADAVVKEIKEIKAAPLKNSVEMDALHDILAGPIARIGAESQNSAVAITDRFLEQNGLILLPHERFRLAKLVHFRISETLPGVEPLRIPSSDPRPLLNTTEFEPVVKILGKRLGSEWLQESEGRGIISRKAGLDKVQDDYLLEPEELQLVEREADRVLDQALVADSVIPESVPIEEEQSKNRLEEKFRLALEAIEGERPLIKRQLLQYANELMHKGRSEDLGGRLLKKWRELLELNDLTAVEFAELLKQAKVKLSTEAAIEVSATNATIPEIPISTEDNAINRTIEESIEEVKQLIEAEKAGREPVAKKKVASVETEGARMAVGKRKGYPFIIRMDPIADGKISVKVQARGGLRDYPAFDFKNPAVVANEREAFVRLLNRHHVNAKILSDTPSSIEIQTQAAVLSMDLATLTEPQLEELATWMAEGARKRKWGSGGRYLPLQPVGRDGWIDEKFEDDALIRPLALQGKSASEIAAKTHLPKQIVENWLNGEKTKKAPREEGGVDGARMAKTIDFQTWQATVQSFGVPQDYDVREGDQEGRAEVFESRGLGATSIEVGNFLIIDPMGHFVILPVGSKKIMPINNLHVLQYSPGVTIGALKAIEKMAPQILGKTVIDYGAHSGVLGIAASSANPSEIVFVEREETMHPVIEENARENGIGPRSRVLFGNENELQKKIEGSIVLISTGYDSGLENLKRAILPHGKPAMIVATGGLPQASEDLKEYLGSENWRFSEIESDGFVTLIAEAAGARMAELTDMQFFKKFIMGPKRYKRYWIQQDGTMPAYPNYRELARDFREGYLAVDRERKQITPTKKAENYQKYLEAKRAANVSSFLADLGLATFVSPRIPGDKFNADHANRADQLKRLTPQRAAYFIREGFLIYDKNRLILAGAAPDQLVRELSLISLREIARITSRSPRPDAPAVLPRALEPTAVSADGLFSKVYGARLADQGLQSSDELANDAESKKLLARIYLAKPAGLLDRIYWFYFSQIKLNGAIQFQKIKIEKDGKEVERLVVKIYRRDGLGSSLAGKPIDITETLDQIAAETPLTPIIESFVARTRTELVREAQPLLEAVADTTRLDKQAKRLYQDALRSNRGKLAPETAVPVVIKVVGEEPANMTPAMWAALKFYEKQRDTIRQIVGNQLYLQFGYIADENGVKVFRTYEASLTTPVSDSIEAVRDYRTTYAGAPTENFLRVAKGSEITVMPKLDAGRERVNMVSFVSASVFSVMKARLDGMIVIPQLQQLWNNLRGNMLTALDTNNLKLMKEVPENARPELYAPFELKSLATFIREQITQFSQMVLAVGSAA